jgi:ssDNA-binding Zn-finger/Zn-ribbon topoisomerase 1
LNWFCVFGVIGWKVLSENSEFCWFVVCSHFDEQADVNVFRLDLSSLAFAAPLTTGEPVRCGGCGVFLNLFSKVRFPDNNSNNNNSNNNNISNAIPSLELAPAVHDKFESCLAKKAREGSPCWRQDEQKVGKIFFFILFLFVQLRVLRTAERRGSGAGGDRPGNPR